MIDPDLSLEGTVWLTRWQKGYCGAILLQYAGNPPSETCWKSTLWGAREDSSQGDISLEALCYKTA